MIKLTFYQMSNERRDKRRKRFIEWTKFEETKRNRSVLLKKDLYDGVNYCFNKYQITQWIWNLNESIIYSNMLKHIKFNSNREYFQMHELLQFTKSYLWQLKVCDIQNA